MEESYDEIKQNEEKGKHVVEVSGDDIIVEIAGNESGHVQGEEQICHKKSSDGLGQVNEACTDETLNMTIAKLKMQIHNPKTMMLTFQKLLSTLKTWEIMRIIILTAVILISLQ